MSFIDKHSVIPHSHFVQQFLPQSMSYVKLAMCVLLETTEANIIQ